MNPLGNIKLLRVTEAQSLMPQGASEACGYFRIGRECAFSRTTVPCLWLEMTIFFMKW